MAKNKYETFSDPPPVIVMEPHTYCNLTCQSCLTGRRKLDRPGGKMDFSSFKKLISEVSAWVETVHWSGMCEPLLYEDSLAYISFMSGAGINVRLDTNGHFFRDRDFVRRLIGAGLAEVNVAVDGTDQASLAAVRGANADFGILMAGIQDLIGERNRLKSGMKINLQFIVTRPNEHLSAEFLRLGRSLHPDSMTFKAIRLDPADSEACQNLMPKSARFRSYAKQPDGGWRLKGRMLRQCWAIRAYCSIWWDGTLVPCCFDLDGTHAFGNVFETSFREAWQSEAAANFRRRASCDLPSIALCRICPVGRSELNCWDVDPRGDESCDEANKGSA